jgi:hypothetical protein
MLTETRNEIVSLLSRLAEARNRQSCENGQPWVCHALATARSELAEARGLLRSGCTAFDEKRLGKWMQDVAVFLSASDQPSDVIPLPPPYPPPRDVTGRTPPPPPPKARS